MRPKIRWLDTNPCCSGLSQAASSGIDLPLSSFDFVHSLRRPHSACSPEEWAAFLNTPVHPAKPRRKSLGSCMGGILFSPEPGFGLAQGMVCECPTNKWQRQLKGPSLQASMSSCVHTGCDSPLRASAFSNRGPNGLILFCAGHNGFRQRSFGRSPGRLPQLLKLTKHL